MWRLRPSVLMGAAWAWISILRVRRGLKRQGLGYKPLRPPALRRTSARGVHGVIARLSPTCLERALVWQAWLSATGEPRDVVVGVPVKGIAAGTDPAHAWVDGTDPESARRYLELHRIRPFAPATRGKA